MKIKVTKNFVSIEYEDNEFINKGEYKVHKCCFDFSEEYDGLTKKAIFETPMTKKEMPIINDKCDIPYEVLNSERINLRVYAYSTENDELILRYSPRYSEFYTLDGSYVDGAEPSEEITPTQFEQYTDVLNKGLDEVDKSLKILSDTNQKTIEKGEYAKEQGDGAKAIIEDIKDKLAKGELNGATFMPSVDKEGNLSFTNDKGLSNPKSVNIRGPKGEKGDCNFATFSIENGCLIMNKTDDILLDFNLNANGELEVII